MPPYRSLQRAALLSAVALLSACGGEESAAAGGGASGGRPGGGGPPGRGRGGPQVTPVEIAQVSRTSIANTSLVTGLLEPLRTVTVNAQLGGALLDVLAEEGTRVGVGQVLARIDARELAAQVQAAEAAAVFARATANRSEQLFEQQIVTAAEFERDRSALAAAEATLTQLRTRFGFAEITSPLRGVVTGRFVQGGDIVTNNTRLFTVADVSTLVVRLQVSELEVAQLQAGAEVTLLVDALGGAPFDGTIRRIFPAADSVSRLVPVEVAVSGRATSQLRPGYTVRANLQLDTRDDALVVPTRAVLGGTGARSVFVVKGDLAERRSVRVGADINGMVEVFSGLTVGDSVIVAGNSLVRDGGQVRVVDPLSPDAPTRGGAASATAGTNLDAVDAGPADDTTGSAQEATR